MSESYRRNAVSFTSCRVLAEKCREELKGEEHKDTRKQVLVDASAISQAESAAGARERLSAFAQKWTEQAPKAVATLQRDFEQTIAISALDGINRQVIGTTSLIGAHQSPTASQVSARLQFRQSVQSRSGPLLPGPAA